MYKRTNSVKGIGLVEVVIGAALISAALLGLFATYGLHLRIVSANTELIKANFLAGEGIETLRFIRDQGWSSNFGGLDAGEFYHFAYDENDMEWKIFSSSEFIDDKYERYFFVEDVRRDENYEISNDAGGTVDPDIKKINVVVKWISRDDNKEVELSSYIANLFHSE